MTVLLISFFQTGAAQAAVKGASDIGVHPYAKFWIDTVKAGCEVLGICMGGAWACYKFFGERHHKARIETGVTASVVKIDENNAVLRVYAEAKNVGSRKVRLSWQKSNAGERPSSAIVISHSTVQSVANQPYKEVSWANRAAFDIFQKHEWLEPGETLRDSLVVELPQKTATVYKIEMFLIKHRKRQDWCAVTTAIVNTKEDQPTKVVAAGIGRN